MFDDFDDISCEEFYENDLEERMIQESWEDAQAEMTDDEQWEEYWKDDPEMEVDEDTGDCEVDYGDHPWDNER